MRSGWHVYGHDRVNAMNLVRWALVPLSAIAVWCAGILVGIAGIGLLDSLCPPELMVSGSCTARWHAPALEALVLLCTGLVAAGIVIIPAYIAPGGRFHVAAIAFGCGAVFALYTAATADDLWLPFVVAGLTGSASLWFVASRWRRRGIAT